MNWREFPIARLLVPLVLGIWVEEWSQGPEWQQWGALIALAFLLAVLAFWQAAGQRYSLRWRFGLALNTFIFLFGFLSARLHDERRHPAYWPPEEGIEAVWIAEVGNIEPAAGRLRLRLEVLAAVDSAGAMRAASGQILAYFETTARSRQLEAGGLLAISARISAPLRPLNPGAFDFGRYLHHQNIHHQAFVGENQWKRLGRRPGPAGLAWQWRRYFLQVLGRFLPTENEYTVASALILGYKAELSEAVRNAYAQTGAMHVLAVSGLHVGIIQMIFSFLLGLARLPWRFWPLLRTALLLSCIWAFAFLAGASPSVLRAATLFSFLSIGQALRRRANIYNTLAASAFLLLSAGPFLLFNVGFQLSYLAVLGIVYFQPLFYRQWYIRNKLGDYLWKLLSVSLAAQLSTLPLSIYYFHQFPLYFWLSGLVAVPAAALILSAGLALFALHALPVAGIAAGKLLYGLTWMANALIFLIRQIPGGLVEGLWIGPGLVALLYLALLSAVAARESRNFKWVLLGLGLTLAIAMIRAGAEYKAQNQRAVTVYHIPGGTALAIFEGKQAMLLISEEVSEKQLEYAALNDRLRRRVSRAGQALLPEQGQGRQWRFARKALQFGPHRLLLVPDRQVLNGKGLLEADVVLLCSGVDIGLAELMEKVRFNLALIDGSNPAWKAQKWREEAAALGVVCHVTGQQGAWIMEW